MPSPQSQPPGSGPLLALVRRLNLRYPRLSTRVKYLAYRLPAIQNLMFPQYRYWVDPGELASMVSLIDATRGTGGAVVEIGVGRGDTSVFLLEHMRSTGDPRSLVLVDTFEGFTPQSLEHEVEHRGKLRAEISDYSYTSPKVFDRGLARLGYTNYRIVQGDCSRVDWEEVGPIGAVLLDVDLYLPTLATLDAIWPLVVPGGGIVIDDCLEPSWCDGALDAYQEFIARHNLPFTRVGGKGALLRKPKDPVGD